MGNPKTLQIYCYAKQGVNAMREENTRPKETHFNSLPPAKRVVVLLVGHISLFLGVIALLLPLIPTTPFLLLAAACYARTSEKFYNKLIDHKYCGPAILRWQEEKCIDPKIKAYAMALLAITFLSSSFLVLDSTVGRFVMLSIGAIAIIVLYLVPNCNVKKL